jgi:transcriptional regulator with XRE-family HTH domain
MKIGKTLRYLRTAKDVSQIELAGALGVTPSYLSLVEHGRREPSLCFLKRASQHFRIPLPFFLIQDTPLGKWKPGQQRLIREIRHNLLQFIVSSEETSKAARKAEGFDEERGRPRRRA